MDTAYLEMMNSHEKVVSKIHLATLNCLDGQAKELPGGGGASSLQFKKKN